MKLWLDAQLPPKLAAWLAADFALEAVAVRDLGLRDAPDRLIFQRARAAGAVIVSKDYDFVSLLTEFGPPPQLLWVTCGNVSNQRMREVFSAVLPAAVQLLEAGSPVVEIADR